MGKYHQKKGWVAYMDSGRIWARMRVALVLALIGSMVAGSACAITPAQYRRALERNVENYSATRSWSRVAGQLCADEAAVMDGNGAFAITDDAGNDYLATSVARISIRGDVQGGEIVSLDVYVTPNEGMSAEYEFQAFSLSEIAFESLLESGAAYSDMSAYLFLYDLYPCAMWARDSAFGDSSRSVTTALGGRNYDIAASSARGDGSVAINVRVLGEASQTDEADALDNLNANYAFESICSLVYELDVCSDSCVTLMRQGDTSDTPMELMGDMRSCARDYYALGAENYAKLSRLTANLTPAFDDMVSAIESLENGVTGEGIDALESAVNAMGDALREMY